MTEKLHVIRTDAEINQLIAYLQEPGRDFVAYDSETTGLSQSAEIIGLSVCADTEEAWYVVTAEWRFERTEHDVACQWCADKVTAAKETKRKRKASPTVASCAFCLGSGVVKKVEFKDAHLFRLPNRDKVIELLQLLTTKALVMQNNTVDVQWTRRNYNVDLMPALFFETMAAAHLINENRRVGLKELGYTEFGDDNAKKEQTEMRASVLHNGGVWEEKRGGNKEMFKADPDILGRYGAKDALLTLKLGYKFMQQLQDEGLEDFYFEETLPMSKGPIYDLNTVGLRTNQDGFRTLQMDLETECAMLKSQIETDIAPYTEDVYPKGFGNKKGQFNIGSREQMAWLLFIKLDQDWKKLSDGGRDLAKELLGRAPYNPSGRRDFEHALRASTDIKGRPLRLEKYLAVNKTVLSTFQFKYKWVERLLQYSKAKKLLTTYAIGIQEKIEYGVIRPSFLQCGTTGNRLSSRSPNLQNLPRDDKRTKALFIARPGKIFVGADYPQIEPRIFAHLSGDERLIACFSSGEDFYSVIGREVFQKDDCTPYKSGPNAFGERWPLLRQVSKVIALAATYGVTAFKLVDMLTMNAPRKGEPWTIEEVQQIIDDFFAAYPGVRKFQEESHQQAIKNGVVFNMYGRPRHLPQAKFIQKFGKIKATELPYEYRTVLNNSVNFRIQGTAGSVMNRAAIGIHRACQERGAGWLEVKIVGQVHDELWLEGPEELRDEMMLLVAEQMEASAAAIGVDLKVEPAVGYNISELK